MLFAEDPGAWKFFLPLVNELKKTNQHRCLFLSGKAAELARTQKISFKKLDLKNLNKQGFFEKAIIGTSENKKSQGFKLIQWCQNNKIPSIGLVDSPINAKFRFRGISRNPLKFMPDKIVVPEERTKKEFIKLGYPKNRIAVILPKLLKQILLFNQTTKRPKKKQIKVPRNHFVITFASEPNTGLNLKALIRSKKYFFKGHGNSKKRTVIALQEIIETIKKIKNQVSIKIYCILRLHPKEKKSSQKKYAKYFDFISQKQAPADIIKISNLIIGMTSMFLQEACFYQIPVISILISQQEKHWLPKITQKKIMYVSSKKKLEETLKKVLIAKKKVSLFRPVFSMKKYIKTFKI